MSFNDDLNINEPQDSDNLVYGKGVIPCVYLPYALGSSKLLVYFHGNAEDIGLATELLDYIRTLLRVTKFKIYNFRYMF